MKYRIFAFFVLCILIGLPSFFYWFFTTKQVSSLEVSLSENIPFSLHLQGKLSYSLLPLADKILDFSHDCIGQCVLSPIPPVDYTMTLSASGMADIHEPIHFTVGEKKVLKYQFTPNISLLSGTKDDSILTQSFSGIFLLKQLSKSRFLGVSYLPDAVQFGIVSEGILNPLKTFNNIDLKVRLDTNTDYILVGNPMDSYTEIYDLAGNLLIHVPFSQDMILSVSVFGNEWKIKTKDSVYTYLDGIVTENPRFTDFVDISSQYRVGYIDRNDERKIALANLSHDISFLVLLDRYTGNATYKKIPELIHTCFLKGDVPICNTVDGTEFFLKIGK